PAYNLDLSERRAKGVVLELINEGVDSNQLTSKGYGLSKPLESNQTEQGRARNRRTEVLIL
ncbi:MAG: OmpA family protein, partial [Schleiferiaceae bacterium]|nr:OmpA family protein [Schleiferiaceae bacterium]